MRKEKMHAMTRRAFGRSASLLATVAAVSACTNRRGGTDDTTASADLPAVRQYVRLGSSPTFSGVDFDHVSPDPATVEGTVATAVVEPTRSQRLFLWEQESVPSTTAANGSGYDPAGFRPTVASVLAVGDTVRGAVLLCAGGAFAVHGDNSDCYPTATQMSALGYHCFVVDYRVRPYTQAEAGVDLARGIRFVRAHTDDYGLPSPQHIALIGYSAGGILCGETILNWSGATSPTELDADYAPDMLDAVSADAAATAMIYSFYGRLSVAELNPDRLVGAVPTYYCYSTTDPFYDQFEAQVEVFGGARRHAARPCPRRLAARIRCRGRLDRGVRRLHAAGLHGRLTPITDSTQPPLTSLPAAQTITNREILTEGTPACPTPAPSSSSAPPDRWAASSSRRP